MTIVPVNDVNIRLAAERLRAGGLVAIPTETVYGLAADATNDAAVAAIFAAKGRPQFNPVIVHVNSRDDAARYVVFDARADHLASVFWPGPLTMILPRRDGCKLSLLTSAGLPSQAMRVPKHLVARQIISAAGVPLAAPSANASGSLSPTTPQHVVESLGQKAGMILAGGKSDVGLESTVIDLTTARAVLLRPGAITLDDLRREIGDVDVEDITATASPRSPGQLLKHYAPKTPVRLKAVDVAQDEALLAFGATRFMGIKGGGFARDLPATRFLNLSEAGDLSEAAANLFAFLHRLDACGAASIAVMDIPDAGLGVAINDRLRRAAAAQG